MSDQSTSAADDIWPEELRLRNSGKLLTVVFNNAEKYDLDAEFLRVESPSAEVQGHGPDQKVTVAGKSTVAIIKVDPVGNYAVRLTFDDMHSTGIFSWDYLLKLGREHAGMWQAYLDRLEAEGKTR
jgi:DUF971 family protein